MALATSSRRRRRSQPESEEDVALASQDDGDPSSESSPKRARLASTATAKLPKTKPNAHVGSANGAAVEPGLDEFQSGAIVRVSVENFVTYERAEFFPGPHLNMVIGPNGTGKSSLVCAICLGLGYSPKYLGRAGSVKEFVKHGKDTATIEIELKRLGSRKNHVVKVLIRREQNSQKWWLDGKEASLKAVQALMRSLKVQVDNLCQFLPQDRVAEFAACTPVDLLHETLRAAAPGKMLEWHKQLCDLHKDKKEMAKTVREDLETLGNLETRQNGLQADVDRLRERDEIQERVENLRGALILARYNEARDQYSKVREKKQAAERALKHLEEQSAPSLEAVNKKQAYAQQVELAMRGRREALDMAQKAADILSTQVATASDNVWEFNNTLDVAKGRFDAKKKELAASRSRITSFQADLKNQPPEFNAAEWNQKIRAEEHIQRELEAEQRQLLAEIDEIRHKGKGVSHEMAKLQTDLQSLDTQEGQQLNFMKKSFPELAQGWEWVQENQGQFEKEVFGPPMISCRVKDERYSDQIQSLLQSDDFTCFTAQTTNDYKKLTDKLYRELSLSVVIRSCTQPLESFKPPVSDGEAASLGLDGFAVNFLEGPQPVLAMLCAEKRLHNSGVSLHDHGDAEYERLIKNGQVNQWAAGKQSYVIRRRREYGPQAMTTVTKAIQKGRFWSSQPADAHERAELARRLKVFKGERDVLKEELRERQNKNEEIEQKKADLVDKIERLKREKSGLQKDYQKWQSLPERIESEERTKEACEEALKEARQSLHELQYEWDGATVERARLVLQYKEAVDKIRDAYETCQEASIRLIEARSDVQGLKDHNSSIVERLDQERSNVREAIGEVSRTREAGKRLGEEVRVLIEGDDDRRELLSSLCEGKLPDEIEREIDGELASLELIHAANPNVLREFEKRAQEISRLQRKVEGLKEKLGGLNNQLDDILGRWELKLEELVSKINDAFAYNFEQIGCAGEVRIRKDEDFEQWALDIMVRFRENETLQQLTAHRQSGGERAVSTIFYLMALQSMAQSPFRVVDEINQGMDPRNERMVHERMVEIACREHTSQYFLITPKLLTGLRYDPKIRVLCIASGEYMPLEGRKLDFSRCLKVQKRLMVRT